MIGFATSPRFVEHQTGPHHPERPDRIRAIHRAVRAAGMVESPDPFPEFALELGAIDGGGIKVKELEPKAADEKWLATVHSEQHIRRVQRVCELGGGILDQGDTPVGANSCEIAMLSLGSLLRATDAVMTGEVKRAFSAARPPGHHAEPDRAMGFCLVLQRRHRGAIHSEDLRGQQDRDRGLRRSPRQRNAGGVRRRSFGAVHQPASASADLLPRQRV
jgi:acetoin utilization deacetylase AcuC-like enzyme